MQRRDKSGSRWKFLGLVVILVIVAIVVRHTPVGQYLDRRVLAAWLGELSSNPFAPLLFVGVYAVSLGFGIPASLFTLAGGVVFGVWPGALYNWLGTMLGASLAFVLARHLGRDFVERLLRGRFVDLDAAVSARGFWAIFVMRLIPVIPFNLSNFAAGLTGIRFIHYVVATGLAIAPGLTVVTWFAHSLWEGTGDRRVTANIVLASILLVLTTVLPWAVYRLVWRRGKRRPL